MGTTEDGTNSIDLLANCLNQHAHHAQWEAVWMPNDPPTPQQCEQFWTDLKANIAAGFAMPANWVSPDGNHPIAVSPDGGDPGPNPGYYGTVWHYVAYVGLAENERGRFVRVADSGFSPWQYWITFEQACTLMPPKGYVKSAAAPIGAPATPTLPGPAPAPSGGATADLLYAAMGGALTVQRYAELLPAVLESLRNCDCTTENRVAEWMAQIGHESGGLRWMEELADGSAYEGRADLGNTQPGDGQRYKGRGPIQITGRFNYEQVSQWAHSKGLVPTPTFFVDQPELLGTDQYAFRGTEWYWTVARPKINAMADNRDHAGVTQAINGGMNGFDDRVARFNNALPIAGAFLPANNQSAAPTAPAPAAPPAQQEQTCLTGRPHHHSENPPTDQQILDIRAEGLCTQALVFKIAEKLGLDAAGIYQAARESF